VPRMPPQRLLRREKRKRLTGFRERRGESLQRWSLGISGAGGDHARGLAPRGEESSRAAAFTLPSRTRHPTAASSEMKSTKSSDCAGDLPAIENDGVQAGAFLADAPVRP